MVCIGMGNFDMVVMNHTGLGTPRLAAAKGVEGWFVIVGSAEPVWAALGEALVPLVVLA